MELHEFVAAAIDDTKQSLWPAFAPELLLCGTVLLLLLVRLVRGISRLDPFLIAFIGSVAALYCTFPVMQADGTTGLERQELFTGMLVHDGFGVFVRAILIGFAVLFCVFTKLSGVPDREGGTDFYTLILGATIGMCLMASANHLLMVFLAVEMASVPSYALAGYLKGRRESSEAALKYSVYGAGAAGIMLYGISLLAGVFHTAHLPTLAVQISEQLPALSGEQRMVLVLAGLMIMVGLAFKLSAVPFHFWCPDVFEGASAEVGAFLSVASKAAALALLIRVAVGVGIPLQQDSMMAAALGPDSGGTLYSVADQPGTTAVTPVVANSDAGDSLAQVRLFVSLMLAFVAAITCTFGNLAAYGQTNIKRLLAYSTIAHAGYMMLPVPAALALYGVDTASAHRAIAALAIYMAIYLFMNLGAFAIVAFLRNALGSEQIEDYGGMINRSPGLVVCFALILFSLVGIPPLAGFVGKFAIFASLADGYRITGQFFLVALLVIGCVNTVVSLFYYLRVVKVMVMDPEPMRATSFDWSMVSLSGAYVVAITSPLILLFFSWDSLNEWSLAAARNLF